MSLEQNIVSVILSDCPGAVAIYRFGSWGTVHQRTDSDLDVAVLLPHEKARSVDPWLWAKLNGEVAASAGTDRVDLINLETACTTLQAEILRTGDVAYCADENARLVFEVRVLSKYQELNVWRKPVRESLLTRELGIFP